MWDPERPYDYILKTRHSNPDGEAGSSLGQTFQEVGTHGYRFPAPGCVWSLSLVNKSHPFNRDKLLVHAVTPPRIAYINSLSCMLNVWNLLDWEMLVDLYSLCILLRRYSLYTTRLRRYLFIGDITSQQLRALAHTPISPFRSIPKAVVPEKDEDRQFDTTFYTRDTVWNQAPVEIWKVRT